ncbi:hypothetical protein [Janthinobacterium sp. 1_2014MBL_MicDiv]|uniref:hypothetical protein n=1 Tax=Janthinobacterium sp. 1_2014MBL_MicDiv TaxID=1644131 RepID=UPI0008F53EAF|nr:hypothetical protein [Janthinobacterium sp. 1_2014MBL_MicDiv]APA68737.1 hypothetical protein YQ44_14055 [Janthinobacterium sp. 1_2014MBL_MicDiv]
MVAKLIVVAGHADAVMQQAAEGMRRCPLPDASENTSIELETAPAHLLNTLDDDGTLYIDAHGAAGVPADVLQAAQFFGQVTPEQLAHLLMSKGLKSTFQGKIVLNGCQSENGHGLQYVLRFQYAMATRTVLCSVKGHAGASQVNEGGKAAVRAPTYESDGGAARAHRSQRLVTR